MKTLFTLATLALALGAGTAAQACEAHQAPVKAPQKSAEVKCPVMGGKVADTKTAPKSVYQGKTYYFCCPGCKPKFDKDPAKFVKVAKK